MGMLENLTRKMSKSKKYLYTNLFKSVSEFINTTSTYGPNANIILDAMGTVVSPNGGPENFVGYGFSDAAGTSPQVGWEMDECSSNPVPIMENTLGYDCGSLNALNNIYQIFSSQWTAGSSKANFAYNYNSNSVLTSYVPNSQKINIGFHYASGGAADNTNGAYQWIRTRVMPPNDILPVTSASNVINISSTSTTTTTVSTTSSSTTTIPTTTSSTTTIPTTSTSTSTSIPTTSTSTSTSTTTSTFTSTSTSRTTTILTTSTSTSTSIPTTVTSVAKSFDYNSALSMPSITTPTPSTQLDTNTLTWSTSFTGGTGPYTYNWVVYNPTTGNILANMLETNSLHMTAGRCTIT